MASFTIQGEENNCQVGNNILLTGRVKGHGNSIVIEDPKHECKIDIRISGNNNTVVLKSPFAVKGLSIRIGNHVPANRTTLSIDEGFSIEAAGQFLLYNSGNKMTVGKNCMFSNNVFVRCGDSPHLLFDRNTGEYLDISDGVVIGDHVWIGEKVYITKNVSIPSECVVAACSVVTRRFEIENSVLAGNPARSVRENIQWIRNRDHLVKGSSYKESYDDRQKKYE